MVECPDPIEIWTWESREPDVLCGCRRCPEPDPTPEQLQHRVDSAAWRQATRVEDS